MESEETEITFDTNVPSNAMIINALCSPYEDTEPQVMRISLSNSGMTIRFFNGDKLTGSFSRTYTDWFREMN